MSPARRRNVAASVRDRLLARARERGEDFQLVLGRYAIERLLYRLSVSRYRDRFLLKGAMLFLVWTGHVYRPTRDLDLLGRGSSNVATLERIFHEICAAEVADDGLRFTCHRRAHSRRRGVPRGQAHADDAARQGTDQASG